jgi:hypothetical protein
MNSTEEFRRTVGNWAGKVADLAPLARVAIQDLAEAVIDDTHVDTGFLVGNWQPSLNAPVIDADPNGYGNGYPESKISVVLPELKQGDVFYFTNNAAYARRREYGFVGQDSLGRYYNDRGDHMIANNISRWDMIVQGAAQKLGLTT